MQESRFDKAVRIFRESGGILKTAQAVRAGIHPGTLYAMRDSGVLERVSRGVYRLTDIPPLGSPDLVTVATRIPNGVVCLVSALSFHELTTQIPHEVYVALPTGAEEPRVDFPPIRTFRFIGNSFSEGVEVHDLDGVEVRVYSAEKTIADCFKFRNKIGLDIAIEALRFYWERRAVRADDLVRYAAVCRVRKVMQPYLEAILQ